MPTQSSVE